MCQYADLTNDEHRELVRDECETEIITTTKMKTRTHGTYDNMDNGLREDYVQGKLVLSVESNGSPLFGSYPDHDFSPVTINELADLAHANAKEKGFHDLAQLDSVFVSNQCNNLHAEVTELWDGYRAGKEDAPCDKAEKMKALGLPELTCKEEELADIAIRVLDISRRLSVDILRAIQTKHAYNKTRPHMHGKKN